MCRSSWPIPYCLEKLNRTHTHTHTHTHSGETADLTCTTLTLNSNEPTISTTPSASLRTVCSLLAFIRLAFPLFAGHTHLLNEYQKLLRHVSCESSVAWAEGGGECSKLTNEPFRLSSVEPPTGADCLELLLVPVSIPSGTVVKSLPTSHHVHCSDTSTSHSCSHHYPRRLQHLSTDHTHFQCCGLPPGVGADTGQLYS